MEPLQDLQDASTLLLQRAKEGSVGDLASAVEKATGVLRLAYEHEKLSVEVRSLAVQEAKQRYDLDSEKAREKDERRRSAVAVYAPLAGNLILIGGLIFQTYQYVHSERQKQEAAQEAAWQDAVKVLSTTSRVSTAAITLRPFLSSSTYGDRARALAIQLMATSTDNTAFDNLFRTTFIPLGSSNLDDLSKLNRALAARANPLYSKTYDPAKGINDPSKFSQDDRAIYDYSNTALAMISAQIAPVLVKRDSSTPLDLSGNNFYQADFRHSNFQNADISYASFSSMDLDGADFSHLRNSDSVDF
jgi:hypothetical protein